MTSAALRKRPSPAGLRIGAGDAGYKNFGFCVMELTHVDSVVGVQGPRTRTPVPCFKILFLDTLNLTEEVPGAGPRADSELGKLQPLLGSEKNDNNNMPMWRRHLAQRVASQCPVFFERYLCPLTGKQELPVLANENQLDVTGEGATPADREERRVLQLAVQHAKEYATALGDVTGRVWLQDLIKLAARGRLQLKPRDDFVRGRMYTLSQVLAGVVEAVDAANGDRDRLVINAAKKHAIQSDNSRTYAQRKADAIAFMRQMLQGQVDDETSSDDERAHGKHWLAYLDRKEAAGQKLDDMADAFLLAINVAMKVHKKYAKNFYQGPPLDCYAPVTNAEMIEAATRTLNGNETVATAEKRKKIAPRKRAPAKAPAKKRKRDSDDAPAKRKKPAKRSKHE